MKLNRQIAEEIIEYVDRKKRANCRLNQSQLSRQIGVHRRTIVRWYDKGADLHNRIETHKNPTLAEYQINCYLIFCSIYLYERQRHLDSLNRIYTWKKQEMFWIFNVTGVEIPQNFDGAFDKCMHYDEL